MLKQHLNRIVWIMYFRLGISCFSTFHNLLFKIFRGVRKKQRVEIKRRLIRGD